MSRLCVGLRRGSQGGVQLLGLQDGIGRPWWSRRGRLSIGRDQDPARAIPIGIFIESTVVATHPALKGILIDGQPIPHSSFSHP